MTRLNDRYLTYLAKYPLVTKSITAGVLASLNETIASVVTGDVKTARFAVGNRRFNVRHVLSPKILTMIIYGSLIVTPISHYMYKVINKIFGQKASVSRVSKVLQILTSLGTVTPTLSAVFVGWLAIINNYEPPKLYQLQNAHVSKELSKIYAIVKSGLRRSYFTILKTSLVTSSTSLVIAQNFLAPELWVVFFNLVYFVIGTIQNIKVKRAQSSIKRDADKDLSMKKDD